MGISLSVKPLDQQRRQLTVRFYYKCYCATSGVDVIARTFRLASNRYIVRESANVKVCPYQVMISNGLFEETNEQHIFSKVFYNYVLNFLYIILNEKSFTEKFLLTGNIYNNSKTKSENTIILRDMMIMINYDNYELL